MDERTFSIEINISLEKQHFMSAVKIIPRDLWFNETHWIKHHSTEQHKAQGSKYNWVSNEIKKNEISASHKNLD